MERKRIGLAVGAILIIGFVTGAVISQRGTSPSTPSTSPKTEKGKLPSATLKQYEDPSGFGFNYPDDLSIVKNDSADDSVYADIRLNSKEVGGAINIKVTDSKYSSVNQFWQADGKIAQAQPLDATLGTLSGLEIKDKERLIFAALDQGILFTIEVLLEDGEGYWMNVYDAILTSFTFTSPAADTSDSQTQVGFTEEVIFEGEETVE